MADELKPIGVDATGYELLINAVKDLLSSFPGLGEQVIYYEELGTDSGIAFSTDAGALIMSETRDITGHIKQSCQFPFFVIYRTAATREYEKIRVQAFLDTLGKWLCKEPTTVNNEVERLGAYPELADGRKITRITRSNSYALTPNENNTQDWLLPVTVQYTHEFDLW